MGRDGLGREGEGRGRERQEKREGGGERGGELFVNLGQPWSKMLNKSAF